MAVVHITNKKKNKRQVNVLKIEIKGNEKRSSMRKMRGNRNKKNNTKMKPEAE